jgi:hypothetical protein
MRLLRRAMQRLLIAGICSMLATAPVAGHATATPTLDGLWNQPQGLSMDSALYVVQAWWDGYNDGVSSDPTQRGFDELSRANADLLNAYTLLEHAHSGGPQPIPIVDPLLANAYDAVTGSNDTAPVASMVTAINNRLLSLEGRGSNSNRVGALLEEYRAMQAAAIRDLRHGGASSYDALIASNAQREADFLTQVQRVSTPDDGLASLFADATLQTTTVAKGQSLTALATSAHGNGKGSGNANTKGNAHASGHGHGQGAGNANPQPSGPKR